MVPRMHHQNFNLQFDVNLLESKLVFEREHSLNHSHCASQPFSRFEQIYFELKAGILVVGPWNYKSSFFC
jgi:hypothetical protein